MILNKYSYLAILWVFVVSCQLFPRLAKITSTSLASLTLRFPGKHLQQASMSTSNFSSYLKSRKANFLADNGKGWTVVMGNEAGDLDSLASALGYAWLRSNKSEKAIAYITTPKEDFVLRAENLYALGLAGINYPFEELYCSGDPMPSQVSQFALVDHNVLHTRHASPTARVVAVIDHHEDEGQYKDTADPRIVEPAGSCSSLIARLYQSSPNLSVPPELSTLLLSAILIDTHGLKEGGKALDVDREAAAFLKISASSDKQPITHFPSVQSLSATLGEKKLSVSHLSTRDLLRRDYKEYAFSMPASEDMTPSSDVIRAGLATVPLRLSAFFASSNYPIKEIQDWLAERDLGVLGILTTFRSKKGKGRREQLWIIKADEGIAEKLWQGLESSEELKLKRLDFSKFVGGANAAEESEDEDAGEVTTDEARFGESYVARAYKQGNANATRKQTAPILRRIMDGL
ncbi:hypothetical protein DFJ58DRAFT_787981 [Suillus subalutaceus]|uniref:uncharacterized protein n=1 Tax=Suillus subalutaceus TaxID=48586 RepID=UPI001B87EBDE|nr:uncharacterized protein DFJ58DRAFT_787981 [Suillus subalutaceus]KAG1854452.1 hypothetical protein DFJ58DRAFT_787981 [Suillus subalutaceus]